MGVFRSGCRLNTDGSAMPVLDMLAQIVTERRPRLVISVGLGGGVRPEHQVGDVVVTSRARFDLTGELDSYEDNERTFGTDGPVPEDWLADLRFDEFREPACSARAPPSARPRMAGRNRPPIGGDPGGPLGPRAARRLGRRVHAGVLRCRRDQRRCRRSANLRTRLTCPR